MCNLLEEKRNIEALLKKYFSNFWRNTSGSEIKSVAVKMSDMVEALKQVGNNLEEAWANLVQEHFSNPVLQVNYSNLITSASTPSQSLLLCQRSSSSPACPAGFCLADNTIQWRPLLSLQKRFSSGTSVQRIHYLVVVVLQPNQLLHKVFWRSNLKFKI